MGWDLCAYFDLDQEEIEKFITENNIDREEEEEKIEEFFKSKYLADSTFRPMYSWNEDCSLHEINVSHHTSFIRDDERFENRRFQAHLEKKVGRPFPQCLKEINWGLRTREDALEVAGELEVFFPDDLSLKSFASWLRKTAPFCSTYELSC
jgi:hypothetical protein